MAKEKKTSKEIAATILACCIARNLDIQSVTVWPSEAYGWDASFAAAPALLVPDVTRFEGIVLELRTIFELIDEYK
jgi:hypothetical protein